MATRRLTLFGKITFIKSLLVPQLMCILTPLPTYAVVLQKVNKLLFEFLWDGKGDEIKIEFITKDHKEGGLRMIGVNIRSISPLKLPGSRNTLIRQIMENGNFLRQLKVHGGKLIFSCNLHKDDTPLLRISNPFVREVLST